MKGTRSLSAGCLYAVAAVQAVAGVFLSVGCLCEPDVTRVGFFVGLGMAAYVTANVLLAGWALSRAVWASAVGLVLYVALLGAMGLPSVKPSVPAWYAQLPAAVLLIAAFAAALRGRRDVRRAPDKIHHHGGRSSELFVPKRKVLAKLGVSPGQTVVDAGCGNGYMAKAFAEAVGAAGKVYALDPDESVIQALVDEGGAAHLAAVVGDITRTTDINAGCVDLIYLSNVFHGFSADQLPGFNVEVRRLLKPGGRLAVLDMKKIRSPFGPPLDIRYSPDELKQAVDLAPVALSSVGAFLYLQIFENRVS